MAAPALSRLNHVLRNQGQPITNFTTAPTWVDVVALTGGAAKSYTVPAGATMLRLTPTVIPTYGNFNSTAAAPTVDKTDGSGSFPVGGQTYMVAPSAGSTLSLICAADCKVTVEVWS